MKKIGFSLTWDLGSLERKVGNVLGDELYARSLVKAMKQVDPTLEVDVYAPNRQPAEKLDVMIYMNDNAPRSDWAVKSVLYLQNAYGEGADRKLAALRENGYDGYAFISRKLLDMHQAEGYSGIFLPFGVDTSTFYPRKPTSELAFDVAYVGNDVKGTERSEAYLEPAADFNFGLYGNWRILRARFRVWRNWGLPKYKRRFERLSRGKIPQEQVPILYSSSKINLNCTIQDCVDWDVITLRTLEVLACDGFLISDRVPSAEKLLGDFVVFTDGHDDLRGKIRRYISDDAGRVEKARAGGKYVRDHFSIQATAANLLNYLQEI
ncbi:glycosyltransferase [Curvibacter sp. CHRR-16]|uniref:glycosyltransferase family protein n=1 Tax=Curvibacter sp. CHRR-16 TaxID=2835872 RepID=UPI001BD98E05|nr:glycosyltransferase [Curvibacter sp. CHRR-16]MBT0571742.1 glycosyltransferase [Curvibacter sp. CHRR-16]